MRITGLTQFKQQLSNIIFGVVLTLSFTSNAEQAVPSKVADYLEQIATINLMEQGQQEAPHKALLAEIETYWEGNKEEASAWIVVALSRASYARSQGMGALGLMKQVRRELETAIELDPKAMNGYANSFLGRVYFLLPGWPLSYGSDKKAKKYIEESLAINDQSMENHFAYGWFLSHEKQYDQAKLHLQKAQDLPSVIDNANWVAYLEKQIDGLLEYAKEKAKK